MDQINLEKNKVGFEGQNNLENWPNQLGKIGQVNLKYGPNQLEKLAKSTWEMAQIQQKNWQNQIGK